MHVSAVTEYDYKTIRDFTRFSLFKGSIYKMGMPIFLGTAIVGLSFCILMIIWSGIDPVIMILLAMLAFLTALMLFLYFVLPSISYKSRKKIHDLKFEYEFMEDTFTLNAESPIYQDNAKMQYNLLNRVYETKQYFYLYLNKAQAFIVKKSGIISGTEEELRTLLKSLHPKVRYVKCK